MSKEKLSYLLLKLAVAFPLLYMAWGIYLRPKYFAVYIPNFLTQFISHNALVWIISALWMIVAAFIIFERKPFVPPMIAAVYLGLIVFSNARWGTPSFDIFYKDIVIILSALALAVKSKTI